MLAFWKEIYDKSNVLKSKNITLLAKILIVKPMIFPVIMCCCESWTIKKTEYHTIHSFELWCWRRLMSFPWTAKASIKSVIPKENQCEIFTGRTDAQAEAPIIWPSDMKSQPFGKDPDAWKIEGKRRRRHQRVNWLDSITDSMDMNWANTEIMKDREDWHVAVHWVTKIWTWLSNWTTTTVKHFKIQYA